MTTNAKLKSKLPTDGHGLSIRLCDAIYDERAHGKPTDDLLIVGRISPIGHGEENGKRFVTFEIAQLEIATEHPDTTHVRDILTAASDKRHGGRQLPLGFDERTDEDKRKQLFADIEEWAAEEGLTPGEVGERWRDYFGIEPDAKDTPAGYAPVDYRQADAHRLLEFCLSTGVVAESDPQQTLDVDGSDDEKSGKDAAAGN